jgi:serine/threonine-protein kinase
MDFGPGVAVTGDIVLTRPLSSGAMGRVWVATHAKLGREVAVKFMADKGSRDRAMQKRFQREAEAASQISSPHVVKILEHGTSIDGVPYIAMELLSGETLGERLEREGKLGLDRVASIVRQVGSALDAAHARGIVHRDIKPDNLFLVGDPNFPLVKVLDFGMAKMVRERNQSIVTATGVAVGTPEYMSPEQVLGAKDVDYRTDLWALAVVAYRAITGQSAFVASTPHALFFTICKGSYTPVARHDAPNELEPWFKRAFTPAKEKRFGSAREMVLGFETVISAIRATVDDDDDSTQLLPPAERIRTLDLFAARHAVEDEPSTARGGRGTDRVPASVDHLAATIDLDRHRHDIDDDDSADSAPTQQVEPAVAVAAMRAVLDNLSEDRAIPPDSATMLRHVTEPAPPFPPGERDATISLGNEHVSEFETTLHSARLPQVDTGLPQVDTGLPQVDTGHVEPADESVPGLSRDPFSSDAPRDAEHDADRSGPRAAIAPHSADTSGARISMSAVQADELLERPLPPSSVEPLVPPSTPQRAALVEPKRRSSSTGKLVTAGAAIAVVAGLGVFLFSGKRDDGEVAQAPAASASPAQAAPRSAEPKPAPAPPPAAPPAVDTAASAPAAEPASISIICKPQCVQVRIDDEPIGPTPILKREVPAGKHRIGLQLAGATPTFIELELKPGEHVSRTFSLGPAASAAPATAPSPTPAPQPVPEDPYGDEQLPRAPGESAPP